MNMNMLNDFNIAAKYFCEKFSSRFINYNYNVTDYHFVVFLTWFNVYQFES